MKLIYRTPYGKCRSLGVFIITPPPQCHNAYNHVLGVGRKPLLGMDRKDSIKFKLMPDGAIRAHDSRYGCGVSEWHIITPPIYATR